MLPCILIAAQLLLLLFIAVLVIQILRYWRQLPKDEAIDDERAKYIVNRTTGLIVCIVILAALQITSAILRFSEGL